MKTQIIGKSWGKPLHSAWKIKKSLTKIQWLTKDHLDVGQKKKEILTFFYLYQKFY